MTWKDRRQSDRNAPGKADLPAMGVPAEEQAKVSVGSLLIDLRCVRQQDRKIPEGILVAWPAPGSEDTELGVFMGPEVSHGETKVYAGVQA